VVFKSITVIGIGTLGAFVANAISNLETLETLIVIDHDIVETKNLTNSIYREIDVGISKCEALNDIITHKNKELTIITMEEKYIEGKTKIPPCDLVLDCRDYTYDRRKEIDVRLYISSRYLMVDCRKNVNYKIKTEGKYLVVLNKQDLRYAAGLVAMFLSNNTIDKLLKDQNIQKYELDYVKNIDSLSCDIVYENPTRNDKFINLPDNILPILEANKQSPLDVCVGSRVFPISEYSIPQNTLQSGNDIILKLAQFVECHNFNNFVISLHKHDNIFVLELIPETGAA
jgi:molybdopterin/thiamine biosynthesis adenylyltransferase